MKMKNYQNFISEEFLLKNINLEIFNYPNLNKGYTKINKVAVLFFILLRFIIDDFNFDITLKNNLKKIFSCMNEIMIGILENFIFPFVTSTVNNNNNNNNYGNNNFSQVVYTIEKFKENVDKYLMQTKSANRIKKNKRDLFITIVKSVDSVIMVIKNFSR